MSASPNIGRRERKKDATRRALEDAALDLFQRNGYDATAVEDITEAADVSRSTFFRYFESKEDVVLAREWQVTILTEALERQPAGTSALDSVRAALILMAEHYQEQASALIPRARLVAATGELRARHHERVSAWEDELARFAAVRIGRGAGTELYARAIAIAGAGAMRTALSAWAAKDGRLSLPAIVDALISQFATGLEEPEPKLARVRTRR